MSLFELLLVAVGLSMDAFSVALCQGLDMHVFSRRKAAVIAVFFGTFQALMPLIGWIFGKRFERYITSVDHWIAFILLAFIGAKMIHDSLSSDHSAQKDGFSLHKIFFLAIATSIDALAVGITFAFLSVPLAPSVAFIGIITLLLSFSGVAIGNRFGIHLQSKAELLGGAVLIAIGAKILLNHLGILPF